MHPLSHPHEPHFVHLSWAVRRLTTTQAKYIRLFYGPEALKALGGVQALAAQGAGPAGHGSHAGK